MKRIRSKLLGGALGVLTSALAVAWIPDSEAADIFRIYEPGFLRKAEIARLDDNPRRVIAVVDAALARFQPTRHRAEGLSQVCQAHLALDEVTLAKAACERAVELQATEWHHWNNLGVAHVYADELNQAKEAFARASWLAARVGRSESRTARRNLGHVKDYLAVTDVAAVADGADIER
jgi:hypothetical protein